LRAAFLGCVLAAPAAAQDVDAQDAGRVVALGGAVTEIVYALGQGDRVVARDTTSTFPPGVMDLPDVGYVRALSPEGVLSVAPDLILAIEGSGPPEAVEVLEAAGVPFVIVPEGFDADAIRTRIETVAQALGVPEAGQSLADRVTAELDAAIADARRDNPPRVLFILSMQGGRIMAAGEGTGAAGIIALAGGTNALSGIDGYQQVSDEAVLAAAPDVILMMERTGDHAAGDGDILSHPALRTSPAAERGALVRLPGMLLLGFGPRTPEAVRALSAAFGPAQG
jgi:iron complex transport system substrate-binding protein